MKIGWDLDGVLAHLDKDLLKALKEQGFCQGKTPKDITCHNFEECFPDITPGVLEQIFETPGFFENLMVCPALVRANQQFAQYGHEQHLLTARRDNGHIRDETRRWAVHHGIVFQYLALEEAHRKRAYACTHGLDLVIEDRFDTANQIAEAGIHVFLVEAPYNTPHEYGRGKLHPWVSRYSRQQIFDMSPVLAFLGKTEIRNTDY